MDKNLFILASGTSDGGGSGFEKMCRNVGTGVLKANIVGVGSEHLDGGVRKKAEKYGIPFFHFPKPWTAEKYQELVTATNADFVACSGWLHPVRGLDPRTTFNIHPGPLPEFGGKGMYGHHVHEAVLRAYQEGKLTHSAVTKHFVTDFDKGGAYDDGLIFFEFKVKILPDDTAETLGTRVNKAEHEWQSFITNKVIHGEIAWDGKDPASLVGKLEYMDMP